MNSTGVIRLKRGAGYFIDWYLISLLLNGIIMLYTYQKEEAIYSSLTLDCFEMDTALMLLSLMFLVEILYFGVIPAFVFQGQTLGKKFMKMRIVSVKVERSSEYASASEKDGQIEGKAGFRKLLVRDIIGMIFLEGCFSPLSNYFRNVLMIAVGEKPVQYLVYAYTVIGMISIFLLLFDKKGRMLHDYVSGTKVTIA